MSRSVFRGVALSLCAIVTLFGASTCAASRRDTVARETWYVLVEGDRAWGTTRVQREPLGDGRTSYLVDSRVLTELLGRPQEMTGHGRVVVGPNLAPLHAEYELTQLSGTVRVEGEAVDDKFLVTARHGDDATASTYSLSDEPELIADAALETWLHRLPVSATTARVRVFDSGSGSVRERSVELVERTDAGVTWRIDRGAVPGEHTVRLDSDGIAAEQLHRFPPLRITRHPDASGLTLVHRRFEDRELLTHAVDHELPPLRRIAELSLRLSWRDIDPKNFELEDSRQSVRSLTTESGQTTAIVDVRRPNGSRTDTRLPITDAQLAPFLAETDFIKPLDAEIVRSAKQVVGDTTSARAAAEALCAWAASAIETVMIAETLSGPEVLRRRVGKCTEFATLYASLARAVGIPTRIVLGLRLVPGGTGMQWGGHMWNEVWIGEWVPVDASHDEFGGSPALLKFVHSDTVAGTQDLRWRLTESLAISVIDVTTLAVGDGVAGAVDGLHAGVWTSVERGIRFRLPDARWRVDDKRAPGVMLLRLRPPEDEDPGDGAMIHFTAFELATGIEPSSISHARLGTHRASFSSLELLHDDTASVNGAIGHRTSFRGVPKDAPPLKVTELVWSKDGTGCLLNLIATEELHDAWLPLVEEITASFEYFGG